jgi:hypothetical protein
MAQKNMEKARTTYGRFVASLKYSVPILAVIVLVIVILIAE